MALHLQIITPEKIVFDDEVEQVGLPTTTGQITILEKHADLVTQIEPGEIFLEKNHRVARVAAGFGFARVGKDSVKVLVDLATPEEEIEEKKIEEAKRQAEEAIKQKHALSEEEYATAAANLQKALVQLKIKRRHRRV
ncbi:ATP synthase F1 subunit epsilon [Candidatus Curtissbacteria bacterium RIFCSPHIGHO2_01_FULL_41_44]|uniref:ATP synthase epsilon chain n=1 Tax=Candidatus Curtissbacteria bacterium RIFCSPLOWO2_01_FULL_42_50 TaxID=1797730 RepID=A0A1F5H2R2_9BACT|nr:MAG: ATP synthase F1 subunit epsilon [Candidatus Curtissbacteria bacterium RIFCSPHIGHO2_02_FULL_42_58]OGD93755.1 MAG: ATP synthase F1 subunit epsilon [Candidatus Curtissbacteria bacterium RIFCSPHIGHO2_01_FULL_41_44]OGD97253.1 MAG: ATP synthase F1 subunit epsilon [Candidatus Curtissbacteria bacterium RIFCSPHIGHO2_12_FULL_42_33]OGD98423.1 MAG: ATP synthase F1 subunit epsilon [Candidatus Curtissbacteria bacterium RIFCSPLOWO2_01_FULL_42_50]OGE02340.1 MAG: ATP synthase F1 subunit epsilon [Candida